MERLGALSVLQHCDRTELRQLARTVEVREAGERDVLCRRGEASDEVYLVARGYLGVVVDDELVATMTPGDIAGELGPLGPGIRNADLVALTDLEVFVLRAASLRQLLGDCPGLRRSLTPILASRTDDAERPAAG